MRRVVLPFVLLAAGCLDRSPYEPRFTVAVDGKDGNHPLALTLSDTHLWWSSPDDVHRALKGGEGPEELVAPITSGSPGGLLADGEQAFYVDGGSLWTVTVGEDPEMLSTGVVGDQNNGWPIVQDEASLFFLSFDCGCGDATPLCPRLCPGDQVVCVCSWPKAGGAMTMITPGAPDWYDPQGIELASSESALYFSAPPSNGSSSDRRFYTIQKTLQGGSADWEAASLGPGSAVQMMGDEAGALFAFRNSMSNDEGEILSFREDTEEWVTLGVSRGQIQGLGLGPDHVYWIFQVDSLGGSGRIGRIAKNGGDPETLADFGVGGGGGGNQERPTLAADATDVYWTNPWQGRIAQLAIDP